MSKIKINYELVKKFFYKGLTDREIAVELGCSKDGIYSIRKRIGLNRERSLKENGPIEITKEQEEILIGHLFGDGYLEKSYKNTIGKIEHGEKQYKYALWKHNKLNSLCSDFKIYQRKTIDKRTNKYYKSYGCKLKANPELNKYYDIFYEEGRKVVNKKALDLYTNRSLAIHYMDDGNKATTGGYILATNCFTSDELKIFQEFLLNKFNLITTIHKGNKIYINKKSGEIFKKLVSPFIIESMKYKLH